MLWLQLGLNNIYKNNFGVIQGLIIRPFSSAVLIFADSFRVYQFRFQLNDPNLAIKKSFVCLFLYYKSLIVRCIFSHFSLVMSFFIDLGQFSVFFLLSAFTSSLFLQLRSCSTVYLEITRIDI